MADWGRRILETRKSFPRIPLGGLYDPSSMPSARKRARRKLDLAVDAAYGLKGGGEDSSRTLERLLEPRRGILAAEAEGAAGGAEFPERRRMGFPGRAGGGKREGPV
ncbi:MAG: hypothetical protein LBR53_09585 [Deltaproteobacteria bacterium]|jgi:hypothetical protein|nr:hypothetical protein [Deltaproteobacteria bacterium]